MTVTQYNVYPVLSPVRVASTGNVAGTYNNGPSNNGVGASLTGGGATITVDSVAVATGDRVMLTAQTNVWENGIYTANVNGPFWILTRSDDLNDIENVKAGFFAPIGAGTANGGDIWMITEPLPPVVGQPAVVNKITFVKVA